MRSFHLASIRSTDPHHPNAMSDPNPEQAAVLSHLDGTLLVLAPAGTGKTRLMADRLARNQGVGESRPDSSSFDLRPSTFDLRPSTFTAKLLAGRLGITLQNAHLLRYLLFKSSI